MARIADIFAFLMSSRQLTWPMLFVMGVSAGVLLGLATGLPVTGKVIAGTAPLSSILPERPATETIKLGNQHTDADAPIPARVAESSPTSRVVVAKSEAKLPDAKSAPPMERPTKLPQRMDQLPAARITKPFGAVQDDGERPKIALVIDDLGLDRAAFDRVNALPGPITLAFLPYGSDAQGMLDDLREEHEAIMHLPMEPQSNKDNAGPDMLLTSSSTGEVRATLIKNLEKLSGYVGVNNHTGSQFTADPIGMSVVLKELSARDLFFLDSLTTKDRVAKKIATGTQWRVIERNIFLDGEWPDVSVTSVKDQIAKLERIAQKRGYAIGIAHPYEDTIDTIGPWLVTAEARGFDLVLVSELVPPSKRKVALAKLR